MTPDLGPALVDVRRYGAEVCAGRDATTRARADLALALAAAREAGASFGELAMASGLTRQRVAQILR